MPILQILNWEKQFFVSINESWEGISITLAQMDEQKYNHSIYYASTKLMSAEMNYMVIERKRLEVIFTLKNFRHYLLGTKTLVVTNHQALVYILNKSNAIRRITQCITRKRWFFFSNGEGSGSPFRRQQFFQCNVDVGRH